MTGLSLDLELLWLHSNTYAAINFASSVSTPTEATYNAHEVIEGPTTCEPIQFYNGIECVSNSKTLYSSGSTPILKIPIPVGQSGLRASAWVFVPSLDSS